MGVIRLLLPANRLDSVEDGGLDNREIEEAMRSRPKWWGRSTESIRSDALPIDSSIRTSNIRPAERSDKGRNTRNHPSIPAHVSHGDPPVGEYANAALIKGVAGD